MLAYANPEIPQIKLLWRLLISGLGVLDQADQFGQASRIHVADRDRFEIGGAEADHVKS